MEVSLNKLAQAFPPRHPTMVHNLVCVNLCAMHEMDEAACPRCGATRLHRWQELSAAEREVVRRLPASMGLSVEERASRRRWCTRCWYETTGAEAERA
jgi:hypothetical protein